MRALEAAEAQAVRPEAPLVPRAVRPEAPLVPRAVRLLVLAVVRLAQPVVQLAGAVPLVAQQPPPAMVQQATGRE